MTVFQMTVLQIIVLKIAVLQIARYAETPGPQEDPVVDYLRVR